MELVEEHRAILVTPALPAPYRPALSRQDSPSAAAQPNRFRTVLPLTDTDADSGEHAQRRLLSRFAQTSSLAGKNKGLVLDISA